MYTEYFVLARDRSLKLNTSFPVLYFDEVPMYNVIEFEFSKIRDTDRPVPLHLRIEFYLFVSHGGMKRQRVHV